MAASTLRVLVIDDEESDFLMTHALLGRIEGALPEVEWASSYAEGLDRLGERRHDVCLLDYFLEQRTGLELLGQARAQAIRTPIILLTGKGSRELDLEVMRSGAVDYLVKGAVDPEALERALRYAVERHRAQEALRQSEERHRGMFDHLPLGLYRVTEQGEYIEANPALIRTLEFPERDVLHEVHARSYFVSPTDRDHFHRALAEQGVVLGFETELRTSTGRPIRVRNTARVQRGPAGSIEYIEGTVEDVSASRPLRETEADAAAFRALYQSGILGILRAELDGRILEANPVALGTLGIDGLETHERVLWDLFHPEEGAKVAGALEALVGGASSSISRQIRLPSDDGDAPRAQVTFAAVPDRGGEIASILVLLDDRGGGPER